MPAWSSNGKEVFYMQPDGILMAVNVTAGATLQAGHPVRLFRPYYAASGRSYDVAPDAATLSDDQGVSRASVRRPHSELVRGVEESAG